MKVKNMTKKNKSKNILFIVLLILILILLVIVYNNSQKEKVIVTNFDECVAAGNPVMESYPQQCSHKDQTFAQDIGNELEKSDFVQLDNPRPNQVVTSPLQVTGEIRGYWFFEGDFPIYLQDSQGNQIAQGIGIAQGPWMTVDFVEFKAELVFDKPQDNTGFLILEKDNPSDFSEQDDSMKIPVKF